MPRSVTQVISTGSPTIPNGDLNGIRGSGIRAYYALMSQGSSSVGGCVFLDDRFQMVNAWQGGVETASGAEGVIFRTGAFIFQDGLGLFSGVSVTTAQPSTSATASWMSVAHNSGEFGNSMMDVYCKGTINNGQVRGDGSNYKHNLNGCWVNSDHLDNNIEYILINGVVRAVERRSGNSSFNMPGTVSFTVPGLSTSARGTASYNRSRREFLILHATGAGTFTAMLYRGVNLDTNPSPNAAFTAAGVTRVDSTITIPNWDVNNAESQFNIKPVLCDSGRIFFSVMFVNTNLRLYEALINSTTFAIPNPTLTTTQALTTTFGLETSSAYGQRAMKNRAKDAVMVWCPYSQYGAGMRSFIIDRRLGQAVTGYGNTDTTNSYNVVPYGTNGFAIWQAAFYSAASLGGNIISVQDRTGAGEAFQSSGGTIIPGIAPLPNSTNYPALTQVTDFHLIPSR